MLILPAALRAPLLAAARHAFPAECCGLLEGTRGEGIVTVTAFHPAANVSPTPQEAFEIDPAVQFALQRALRGSGRQVVGCYHSHPNGRAEPSARDRAHTYPEGFVWVIIATGVIETFAAFEAPSFQPLTIRV
jgi:proteasome lid subunit RPN8/RPN11